MENISPSAVNEDRVALAIMSLGPRMNVWLSITRIDED